MILFFLLTHEYSADAEVFSADKGNQSRWSHEGYTEGQGDQEDISNSISLQGQITEEVN